MKPEAEYILDSQHSSGWTDFYRTMFWLAVICGGFMVLHGFLLIILKFRKRNSEKNGTYGALVFPRFEIFLLFLALPGISKASTGLIRGGAPAAMAVGVILLIFVSTVLLALFLFLSVGITFGKLLQYKEVHHEGETFHWYQELIRVTLGPGKRGQWTWKEKAKSVYLTIFGPLFEDLRGPPKYMLSQISGGSQPSQNDHIIASDDETEDAEAPFIQKLFGILRIYFVFLESIRRVALGILAGVFIHTRSRSSKSPIIIMLSITSFMLFFMVLKKPFIKKKVQLVEIISLTCEVAFFATCFVLLKKDFSVGTETKFGIFMLVLFLVAYCSQIANEWYALYAQTKLLDHEEKSVLRGLKVASIGFVLYFIPKKWIKNLEKKLPQNGHANSETRDNALIAERCMHSGSRSSGTPDIPWLKRVRELAKGSFSKDRSGVQITDPSTSSTTRWSGFWGNKRSGSSSSDYKPKPKKALDEDLEAIFASKS